MSIRGLQRALFFLQFAAFGFGFGSAGIVFADTPAAPGDSQVISEHSGAKVFFEEETFDFGSVQQGVVVERDFRIANHGDVPLVISNVLADCGCTVASYNPAPLAPGDSSVIKAKFDTAGFQGLRVKTLRVFTNDSTRPLATLSFKGPVVRDVEVSPSRFYFGTVNKGEEVSASAKISTNRSAPVKILDVESRSEHVSVGLAPGSDDRSSVLHASLKSTAPLGLFRDRVVVKTSSPKNPVVNIPVIARVEGDLHFVPPDISFGLLEGPLDNEARETILLRNTSNKELKIESIRTNSSRISAVVEKRAGRDFVIVVSIARGSSGVINGQVTVLTDHPDDDQRELNLPVYGVISRKDA